MSAHRYTLQFEVTLTPERIEAGEWQAGLYDRDLKEKLRRLLLQVRLCRLQFWDLLIFPVFY